MRYFRRLLVRCPNTVRPELVEGPTSPNGLAVLMGGGLLVLICTAAAADEPSAQRQQELLNLLKHDCGSCHGLPPKGGLGPSLMPEALADKSDALLIDAIRNGRPGTAMPAWQPFFSESEMAWLVGQLRKR